MEPATPRPRALLLPTVVAMAQELVARVVGEGDLVVDATVGNGFDTLFLAGRVGPSGRVLGLDVQPNALEQTSRRLTEVSLTERVELLLAGHERLAEHLDSRQWTGQVKAVMFNLGYQPGGDKALTTRLETTLPALEAALSALIPGGLMTVVLYPGHVGGDAEARAVLDWAVGIPPEQAEVVAYRPVNARTPPPELLAIARRDRITNPV